MIRRGDVWWIQWAASGEDAAERRPGVVVQSDDLNASDLPTIVVVPCTGRLEWSERRGCVALARDESGLPKECVAQAMWITTVARPAFAERAGKLSPSAFEAVLEAIDDALGR